MHSDKLFLMLGPMVLFSSNNAVFQSDAQHIIHSFTKHLPIDCVGPSLLLHFRDISASFKRLYFLLL